MTVRRIVTLIATLAATVAVAAVVIVVVDVRVTTGLWRIPRRSDFVRAEHDLVRIARRLGHKPSKTVFLQPAPVDIVPGEDDAAAGMSGVLANNANHPIKTRGWSGGKVQWAKVVGCVQHELAAFDVAVTDKRPATDDFVLVAVGGYPSDIGLKDAEDAGVSPFSGDVIPRPVVFAFSAQIQNDVSETCEVIAHEVAHTYGVDHEYLCQDVMTYLSGCGHKVFVDKDAPCGEKTKRECEGGQPTQNSYRRLLAVLGTRLKTK